MGKPTSHVQRLDKGKEQSLFGMAEDIINAIQQGNYVRGEQYIAERLDKLPTLEVTSKGLPATEENKKKMEAVSIIVYLALTYDMKTPVDIGSKTSNGQHYLFMEEVDTKALNFRSAKEILSTFKRLVAQGKEPSRQLVPDRHPHGGYWIGPQDETLAPTQVALARLSEFHNVPTLLREVPTRFGTYLECHSKAMKDIARKEGLSSEHDGPG